MLMINAEATTTMGAAPASSIPIVATCELPAYISGPVSHPASAGISACAALTPITSPNGTNPASHGAIARAPAAMSRRSALRLITASSTVRSARQAAGTQSDPCTTVLPGQPSTLEEKWRTPGDRGAAVPCETLAKAIGEVGGRDLS